MVRKVSGFTKCCEIQKDQQHYNENRQNYGISSWKVKSHWGCHLSVATLWFWWPAWSVCPNKQRSVLCCHSEPSGSGEAKVSFLTGLEYSQNSWVYIMKCVSITTIAILSCSFATRFSLWSQWDDILLWQNHWKQWEEGAIITTLCCRKSSSTLIST